MATTTLEPRTGAYRRAWVLDWLTTVDHKKIGILYIVNSFLFFFAAGILCLGVEHFIFARLVTGRAPAWPPSVPGGTLVAYVSGALIVGTAVALLTGRYARIAAFVAAAVFAWYARRYPMQDHYRTDAA